MFSLAAYCSSFEDTYYSSFCLCISIILNSITLLPSYNFLELQSRFVGENCCQFEAIFWSNGSESAKMTLDESCSKSNFLQELRCAWRQSVRPGVKEFSITCSFPLVLNSDLVSRSWCHGLTPRLTWNEYQGRFNYMSLTLFDSIISIHIQSSNYLIVLLTCSNSSL